MNANQRREAVAQIFGLDSRSMPNTSLTVDEIEKMRQLVAAHDANNNFGGIKEFDLNNPPKQPYRYQEFPRIVYHHKLGKTKVVHSAEELLHAEARGYSKDAPFTPQSEEELELDEESLLEIGALEEKARSGRKK